MPLAFHCVRSTMQQTIIGISRAPKIHWSINAIGRSSWMLLAKFGQNIFRAHSTRAINHNLISFTGVRVHAVMPQPVQMMRPYLPRNSKCAIQSAVRLTAEMELNSVAVAPACAHRQGFRESVKLGKIFCVLKARKAAVTINDDTACGTTCDADVAARFQAPPLEHLRRVRRGIYDAMRNQLATRILGARPKWKYRESVFQGKQCGVKQPHLAIPNFFSTCSSLSGRSKHFSQCP